MRVWFRFQISQRKLLRIRGCFEKDLFLIVLSFVELFFLSFQSQILASEPLIRKKIIRDNEIYFHLSADFTKKYVRQPLHLSYPSEIDLNALPSSITDLPLIANVIAVIWLSGERYTIDEMDEDFYHSLVKIKAFFKLFFYNTSWEGELKPNRLIRNSLPITKFQSAALFTGGLDSTTAIFRHADEDPILISFNSPHKDAVHFAKNHHFDLHVIGLNYSDFLKLTFLDKVSVDISKWFWDTSMGLSWIGSAAPLLYGMGIPVLYVPSGFAWQSFIFSDGQTLRQPASPLIDENLSPMGIRVKHDIFTMTRTDKMKFISNYCMEEKIPKPRLVVCNHHKRNDTDYNHCNKCIKCRLTMLDILAIGEKLKDYGFTLSEEDFISQFQSYLENLKIRRGGTYAACLDTQNYLKKHLEELPQIYRPFYDWFVSFDLWTLIDEPPSRPLRTTPFKWEDYQDLYPIPVSVECCEP